jgi:hypothetical protein
MQVRWLPIGVATAGAAGLACASFAGLWEPGWSLAAAGPVFVLVLGAGVLRDPDGPELPFALALAVAFVALFTAATATITEVELSRIASHARPEAAAFVAAEVARIHGAMWPRWVMMFATLPIGGAVLGWRSRRLRARAQPRTTA